MKLTNITHYGLAIVMLLSFSYPTWAVEEEAGIERDPFAPSTWDNVPVVKDVNTPLSSKEMLVNPLATQPLSTYKLVGLMLSPDQSLGVIKTPKNEEYFVKNGDPLGNEGGTIESINIDGITVNTGTDLITIPVSNKIEVHKDEKS